MQSFSANVPIRRKTAGFGVRRVRSGLRTRCAFRIEVLWRDRRASGCFDRASGRRGARPLRRERGGQVDARQDPERGRQAGCRDDADGRRALWTAFDRRCAPTRRGDSLSGTQSRPQPHGRPELILAATAEGRPGAGVRRGDPEARRSHPRALRPASFAERHCREPDARRAPAARDHASLRLRPEGAHPRRADRRPAPRPTGFSVSFVRRPPRARLCFISRIGWPRSASSVSARRCFAMAAASGRSDSRTPPITPFSR